MSKERKVMCPWCRSEMRLWEDGAMAWYTCHNCGAETPTVVSDTDDTPKETLRKMAYAAATATPPNLPLTPAEAEEKGRAVPLGAIWFIGLCCGLDGIKLVKAKDAGHVAFRRNGAPTGWPDGVYAFASPPTPADIAAALEARKGGEHAD